MKYDRVQKLLETYVRDEWALICASKNWEVDLSYDNVAFSSEVYNEFVRMNVLFGDGLPRTVTKGCYRQIGLLKLTAFTRPAEGSQRQLELASALAEMVTSKKVLPSVPGDSPSVYLKVPDLFRDNRERDGWVQAQVSCPFYYDLEL